MSRPPRQPVTIRPTTPGDFPAITELSRACYPRDTEPWGTRYLESHRRIFPEGQFVAEHPATGRLLGMCASLIVHWDEYDFDTNWDELTGCGLFTNHNPHGRTLYGAEIMVHPETQGMGVGKQIYAARRELCRSLGLLRIRAGARLRGYHQYAQRMSPEQYVIDVVNGRIGDPTLSFQLKQGFRVIGVAREYLSPEKDPASHGHAAVIEWLNHHIATREDYKRRDPRYARRRKPQPPQTPQD